LSGDLVNKASVEAVVEEDLSDGEENAESRVQTRALNATSMALLYT
jgi:hypothetical protein